MQHRLEISPSGRATCKTCNKPIGKGELRLGEEYASQFGSEGFAVRWHHVACGATKLPAVLRTAMDAYDGDIPDRAALEAAMEAGAKKAKAAGGALPSADLAPTSRAKCLHCSEPIEKGSVRIAVERELDTGAFVQKGAGYLHPDCAEAWAEEGWQEGLEDLVEKVKAHTALEALPPPFGDASPEAIAALAQAEAKPAKKSKKADAKPSDEPAKASDDAAKASDGSASASDASTDTASTDTTKAAAPKKAAKAKAPAPGEPPPFKELSGKQLAALVAKLAKLDQDYKADSVLEKAGVQWGDRDALRWHLARHGLLEPTHPTLLHRLGESAWQASADDVFAVLPALGKPVKKETSMELIAGWTPGADLVVLRAFELDPARLEACLADASPALRRGIQFVRGRSGATLDAASAKDVLDALAQIEARDWGLPSWSGVNGSGISVPMLGPNGTRPTPLRNSEELALRFGTKEAWLASLVEAAREARFGTLEKVAPALATMPLDAMIALITKPHFSSGELHDAQIERLVTMRDDDPLALAEAARAIGREDYPGHYIREQLLVHAIGRMGARGIAVPEGLEREPKWDGFAYCVAPWRGSKVLRGIYRRALEAVGRERALALVAPILERAWGHSQALPILAVWFDEAIARRLVAEKADQALADPDAFGALGAPVIPLLVEALAAPLEPSPDETKRRDALAKCLRAALAVVGSAGGTFDASLDRWVSCATDESYWREEAKVMLVHSLRAMPEPRRIATLDRLFAETKQVERPFLGVQTVSDAAFRARAARTIVERYGQVADRATLQAGLEALRPDGLEHFRPALGDGKADPKLFEQLRFVYGHAEVEAIMKAANVVEEKDLTRLGRLTREHLAAHPDLERTRIYLLERKDLDPDAPARRTGSFSASRGAGPGGLSRDGEAPTIDPGQVLSLDQVLAMKKRAQKTRSDDEHILTLDLEEIPELAARHPGMRAISLFARFPDTGDEWESGHLVRVPSTCTAPADGSPLSVVPLEVPRAIFDPTAASADPKLKEIRGLVFNRPGYVLGEPMFIQDDEGPGAGFVMQLSERVGDLNLGDSGSLYVFDGAVFMQCY